MSSTEEDSSADSKVKNKPSRSWNDELLEWLDDTTRRIHPKLNRALWWFVHRYHPRHMYHVAETDLEPGYYDPDTRIMHVMFHEVKRFVDFHHEHRMVNMEHNKELWSELIAIYYWWTEVRPDQEDKWLEKHPRPQRNECGDDFKDLFEKVPGTTYSRLRKPTKEYKIWSDNYFEMEKQWDSKDREMMKRVIDILPSMWYP